MAAPVKTVLLFWEGADWPLLSPWMADGRLPVMQAFSKRGAMGNVVSLPPFSPSMLYASAVTGQRAWRHGIWSEPAVDAKTPVPTAEANIQQTPTLWNIMSAEGRTSLVVGGPDGSTARAVEGVHVGSSFFRGEQTDIQPVVLAEELQGLRVSVESLDPKIMRLLCPRLDARTAAEDPLARILAGCLADLYSIHNVAVSLMETEPWELAVVYFPFLENILRHFASYSAGENSTAPRAAVERYADVVEGACRLQDLLLADLLRTVGAEVRTILVSTRGRPVLNSAGAKAHPLRPAGFGLFAASGPGLREGAQLGTLSLLDIAPTLTRLLGRTL